MSERSGNLCNRGNLIVAAQQNNYLYFIRTVLLFFIRDVDIEFVLINVHLFDILPAVSSRKVEGEVGDCLLYGEC